MTEFVNIKVPKARGMQIRAIAKAKGVTIGSLLDEIVADAIEEGLIPQGIPGFSVHSLKDDQINIIMGDFETGPMSWIAAEAFGAILRAVAEKKDPATYLRPALREEPRAFQIGPRGEGMIVIGGGRGLAMLSMGGGVGIKLASATGRKDATLTSLTRSVAIEFAREIQETADLVRRTIADRLPHPGMKAEVDAVFARAGLSNEGHAA